MDKGFFDTDLYAKTLKGRCGWEKVKLEYLSQIFGVEDLREADLSACAADYLRSLGLTDESIAALKLRLSGM